MYGMVIPAANITISELHNFFKNAGISLADICICFNSITTLKETLVPAKYYSKIASIFEWASETNIDHVMFIEFKSNDLFKSVDDVYFRMLDPNSTYVEPTFNGKRIDGIAFGTNEMDLFALLSKQG